MDSFLVLCLHCGKEEIGSKRSKAGKSGFCSRTCLSAWERKATCTTCGMKYWKSNPIHDNVCKKCLLRSFNFERSDHVHNPLLQTFN